eukprot:CAMPEP_0177720898 /NCGR_PEP_ID=MMETSP0484_2-20121128/16859_1 /TAXON_ID=354590 /ORGANISM="Rhodomonas lens, Strain RHODO" /LENGTH=174 /DNA_ID=CAMNT_0019233167 /DNA_START=123 /DNA_END=648 /DNA_ORIENTATION=+
MPRSLLHTCACSETKYTESTSLCAICAQPSSSSSPNESSLSFLVPFFPLSFLSRLFLTAAAANLIFGFPCSSSSTGSSSFFSSFAFPSASFSLSELRFDFFRARPVFKSSGMTMLPPDSAILAMRASYPALLHSLARHPSVVEASRQALSSSLRWILQEQPPLPSAAGTSGRMA